MTHYISSNKNKYDIRFQLGKNTSQEKVKQHLLSINKKKIIKQTKLLTSNLCPVKTSFKNKGEFDGSLKN